MLRPTLYPLQGIMFFLVHPSLWCRCLCGLLVMLLIAIASLVGYSFLISPTAHALIDANCPAGLAWVVAVILMLLESSLTVIILGLLLMPLLQDTLFDDVLRIRGLGESLLKASAVYRYTAIRGIAAGLTFAMVQILVLLLTIPINAIVIVGSILALAINGILLAWSYVLHYHIEVRNMSFRQSRHWIRLNWREFAGFGMVAFALELIPLFNVVFMFTNPVGAGLWVEAEYHKEITLRGQPGNKYDGNMPLPPSLDPSYASSIAAANP
ncbi:hypothetical protein H4R35_002429 [Dimargaris xerosporica]|nr:hypothetical protein H4R35_002429 [Dimargaris xerosporica]